MQISEIGKKIEKNSFVSEIIVSEVVALISLLRRGYLPSGVNVLTKSLKILHSAKIHFFQLNYVHSYQ